MLLFYLNSITDQLRDIKMSVRKIECKSLHPIPFRVRRQFCSGPVRSFVRLSSSNLPALYLGMGRVTVGVDESLVPERHAAVRLR